VLIFLVETLWRLLVGGSEQHVASIFMVKWVGYDVVRLRGKWSLPCAGGEGNRACKPIQNVPNDRTATHLFERRGVVAWVPGKQQYVLVQGWCHEAKARFRHYLRVDDTQCSFGANICLIANGGGMVKPQNHVMHICNRNSVMNGPALRTSHTKLAPNNWI
jgi:hypothetical protein